MNLKKIKTSVFFSIILILWFSCPVKAQSITTNPVSGSPFCACTNLDVSFTSNWYFNSGNIFTVQLSDPSGNFASPAIIGALVSAESADTITCTLPCNAVTGSGYRIRVISSDTNLVGSDNGISLTINALVVSSVDISGDSIACPGDPVLFKANVVYGGPNPNYQWKVNGVNVGTDSSIFIADSLNNGDKVWVVMSPDTLCPVPSSISSDTIIMVVQNPIPALVYIFTHDSVVCAGDPVGFMAFPTGGGLGASYQWKVNGVNVGIDSSKYYSYTIKNGDVVTVVMTSSFSCASPTTATSNAITMNVTTSVTALVSISLNINGAVCTGQAVTFTATPTNGGTTPTYQWQINGSNTGTNSPTFTTSTLNTGDVVTVTMTSNATCADNSPVTSNPVTMTVSSSLTPSVSLFPGPTVSICPGSLAGFLATSKNGGAVPMYQWQVNGVNSGAPTTSRVFSSSTLVTGDIVKVIVTSDLPCANPTTASDSVTIIAGASIPVTVNSATICKGGAATLTASGATTYLWSPGNFTTSSITVSPSATTSYTVTGTTTGCTGSAIGTVTVNAVTVTASSASICAGGSATLTASGGTTYLWNTGATTTSITVAPSSTTSYTVTGTTSGCTGSAVGSVTITSSLTVTVNSPSICAGDAATLTANNGTLYNWSTSETTNPISVSPTVTTTYSVVGTSGTCVDTAISTVTIVTILPVTVNSPAVCPGQSATLTATGGATYSWSTGQTTSSINVPSTPASYTVTGYSSSGGCSGTAIATVSEASASPVTISGNLVINACEETTLTAYGGYSYVWGPDACDGCESITVTPPATQQYYVNYTDSNGCSDGDTVTVVVTTLNTYFVPTALSPNGDGINDEIHFHGRGIDSFTLRIFDRIGEKVFETNDMEKGWGGKLLGVGMNDAVFVYTLYVKFCNGEEVRTKGAITLVK